MKRTLYATAVFTMLWVLLSMHFEPLVVVSGVISIAATITISKKLHILDREGAPFELNPRLPRYLLWLAKEVMLSNVQVARIVLSRPIDVSPHLIRIPANQKTALGQVIHANAITITPGTISLDVRDDVILVHALTDEAASRDDSGHIDRMISWLEEPSVPASAAEPRREGDEGSP